MAKRIRPAFIVFFLRLVRFTRDSEANNRHEWQHRERQNRHFPIKIHHNCQRYNK